MAISAASRVCCGVSTAHGPAIKVNVSGPIGTPRTSTVDICGWLIRLTSLYGADTRITSATPAMPSRFSPENASTSPTSPMIVRVTPLLTKASPPAASTRATTALTSSAEAPGCMTTTTGRGYVGRPGTSRTVRLSG